MDKTDTVAAFVRDRIRVLGKPQKEIAAECGFEAPNVITMIKQGRTKLPLAKVGRMAKALEADPVYLLKLCLSAYQPDTWASLEPLFDLALTQDERTLLGSLRNYAGGLHLTALTPESQRLLDAFLRSLHTSAVRH